MDTSAHDVVLVAGTRRLTLGRPSAGVLRRARRQHPILNTVPDAHLTHHVQDLAMPVDSIQLCYLQRIPHGVNDGSWDMALLFYHHPTTALREAHERAHAKAEGALPPAPVKWARYGITPEARAALNDPVGEETLHDTTSQAVTLVANHPELLAIEPTAAAHIQTNIIGTQSTTQTLGEVLAAQGPATTAGGWATLTPLIDPDTGQPYKNSLGQNQYVPKWSNDTALLTGQAIVPALDTVADDPSLRANITNIDPTTVITNDPNAPTNGAIRLIHDGISSIDQQSASGRLLGTGLAFQLTNQSPDHGYSVAVTGVDSNLNVTIKVTNWFVRYLSVYIRYLDANGQPIPVSTVAADIPDIQDKFPLWDLATGRGLNGEFDILLETHSPELVVLGIPVKSITVTATFPMPKSASSALILAGGLGTGDNPYPATLGPGRVLTIVVNLAVPCFFLALAVASAYTLFLTTVAATNLKFIVQELVILFTDLLIQYDDGASVSWASLGVQLGQAMLSRGATPLITMIAGAIASGEAQQAVTDAIPLIGAIVSTVFTVALAATIIQTSVEVATSPKTYVSELTLTHNVVVTIHHDPKHPAGFPSTATSYTVTAQFDNGTPQVITGQLSTTRTAPITETFTSTPFGGKVKVNVGFYSPDGWLAGQGEIGPVDNTAGSCTTLTANGSLSCQTSVTAGDLSLEFAITENLVPLTDQTIYSHKEIIVLDVNGQHAWQATTAAPTMVTPQGLCENVNGQLCTLSGITISTSNAAVGYAWQAFNDATVDCISGASGQLYQFANLSVTQDPESGHLFSGCGFSGAVLIVYDLLGKPDWNFYLDSTDSKHPFIRQIRLSSGTPSFDGPKSNKAWGRLHFPSNALLLHPLGKILSVNSELNKIEVLELPPAAVRDAEAPQSQVYSGKGIREGRLNGPTLAVLAPDGTILILETSNNRIQAFDLSANPKPHFKAGQYFVPLIDPPNSGVTYLDMGIEYSGYLYVLSYTGQPGSLVYRLDLYTPEGDWLARTTGVNAARLAVDYWRDVYMLNYQVLTLPDGSLPSITEPSVSHWIPSTP
jgi:hypothetical protein